MLSLRMRAWITGGISGLLAITAGTLLLYSFIDNRVSERFDRVLAERHTQIVVALSNLPEEPDRLGEMVFDPVYRAPASGRYWQVIGPGGETFTSASLLEAVLPEPAAPSETLTVSDVGGPDGEELRMAHQVITLENGDVWAVSVAEGRSGLIAERIELRRSLIGAFAMVAVFGVLTVLFQTSAIVRPLERLRKDVAARWDRDEELAMSDYPEEVAPLVGDINTLLHRNRDIVQSSRRQAADLAHALKTPSAILRNELQALTETSHDTERALDALDRMDAQLGRSLARLRLANTGQSGFARTDLSHSADRLARLFGAMARREGKELSAACEAGLSIRLDAQDIEEVLGNLLDNALKWCRHQIVMTVRQTADGLDLVIEDDGPGIAESDRDAAMRSGKRLDTSKPGTGLGLAIANDILRSYDAGLTLERSPSLGGLMVRVSLPAALVRT
jgi:signal transduction histidine kinase